MSVPRPLPVAVLLFVVCGALAGLRIHQLVPAGMRGSFLHDQDFHLNRKVEDRLEVTEASWMFLPFLYGDFDLRMDVDLGEGAQLDVLLRQVEPRISGANDERLQLFTGRFVDLRLSTQGEGSGWRTREQALFDASPGVALAPGSVATVWITGRGRVLTANVAGKAQGTFVADDEYGMVTLCVHGGNVVLHSFVVENRGQPRAWLWAASTWAALGALGALVVAAMASLLGDPRRLAPGASPLRLLRAGGVVWFAGAYVVVQLSSWWLTRGVQVPLAFPDPSAMAAMLGACLVLPLAVLGRARGLVALAAAAALLWHSHGALRFASPQVDAVFGPDSGAGPSQALAQLVQDPEGQLGKAGIKSLAGPRPRVFLLGGQLLYGGGMPTDHLEFQLTRELRAARRGGVDVLSLPTVDGYTAQQWRLFSGFYTGYRPEVIVCGVPTDEMADDPHTGRARSSAASMRETLRAVVNHGAAHAARVVLFAKASLPSELQLVLREFERAGVPLVLVPDDASPQLQAKQLAAAVAPLLP